MISMYSRDKHWLGGYKDATYQYKPKPFGSKMGGCPCSICWKASNEYKIIHTIDSIPYRREVVWEMFGMPWIRGFLSFNKSMFVVSKTQREWKCGFQLGLEGGKYFEGF